MNYGYIKSILDPNHWSFGGVTPPVIQPDGKWKQFIPVFESQDINFETYGCSCFGTTNCIEILIKQRTGNEYNMSDRFVYNIAGVNPPGHDPHDIAEKIRQYRDVDETTLPMTSTYQEYVTPRPVTSDLKNKALSFPYQLNHYWLWTNSLSQIDRTTRIRNALKTSPLGVSVTAWFEENGVYVDKGQPNCHWVALIEEAPGQGWWVYDSYEQDLKIISYDHNIEMAKGYMITEQEAQEITLLKQIINLYQQIIKIIMPQTTNGETLYETAKAHIGQDLAPGNELLGCAISMCAVYNRAFPNGEPLRFVNTTQWYDYMKNNEMWEEISEPEPCCVIVSPTSQIPVGSPLVNGHIGIVGKNDSSDGTLYIMSNDSDLGYWNTQWTVKKWQDYYTKYGLIPTYYFRLK